MDLRSYTKPVHARFATVLDVFLSPPGWLTPFAQIAATQTEDRLDDTGTATSGEHAVHFALGRPEVELEDVTVRFPFTWWLDGYAVLPGVVAGVLMVAPLPDGTAGIAFEIHQGGQTAATAVSLLIDLVALALIGASEAMA